MFCDETRQSDDRNSYFFVNNTSLFAADQYVPSKQKVQAAMTTVPYDGAEGVFRGVRHTGKFKREREREGATNGTGCIYRTRTPPGLDRLADILFVMTTMKRK